MIERLLKKQISDTLFKGRTLIIFGARQVGKTTLVQNILNNFGDDARYLNCEILSVAQNLMEAEPAKLKAYLEIIN